MDPHRRRRSPTGTRNYVGAVGIRDETLSACDLPACFGVKALCVITPAAIGPRYVDRLSGQGGHSFSALGCALRRSVVAAHTDERSSGGLTLGATVAARHECAAPAGMVTSGRRRTKALVMDSIPAPILSAMRTLRSRRPTTGRLPPASRA